MAEFVRKGLTEHGYAVDVAHDRRGGRGGHPIS